MSTIFTFIFVSRENSNYQKKERLKTTLLEKILDSSSLVSRADSKGKITSVNPLFCEVSGYKIHELLGKDHAILNSGKYMI